MICSKGEHELVEGRSKFGFPLQHLLGNVVHLLGVPVDAPRCADERLEAAIARLPVCVDEPHAELDNAVVPPVEAGRLAVPHVPLERGQVVSCRSSQHVAERTL